MEPKETSSRQDVACARCRERKVRCGRERPTCLNCRGDNSECEYNLPEKRVNHTKLLCRNFDRLEDRLSSIEGELSWLTAILKTGVVQEGGGTFARPTSTIVTPVDNPPSSGTFREDIWNKRIVRGLDGLGDQYHGPGTLLSLCCKLKEAFLSKTKEMHIGKDNTEPPSPEGKLGESLDIGTFARENDLTFTEAHVELLERICFVASSETPLEVQEHVTIRLPPKQLLSMVLPQFFAQVDYSTDIFVESHLATNIERIYAHSPTPGDDAWAICFNTIILLVLGSETSIQTSEPLMGSQFSLPFFHAMHAALRQARLLTTPKLINVQALALLSVAAQRYYPCAKGGTIFAQACLLARLAGLHQAFAMPADFPPQEVQERYKTFMSLHLRDKTLSLSWYSICWLPSFDRSLSLQLTPTMFADPRITSRIHLAEIQEQLYRCMSVDSYHNTSQIASEMTAISRNLDRWARTDGFYTLPLSSADDTELQLTFLATRMLAHSRSPDEIHKQDVLDDARACCLMLLVSYEKHDQSMLTMLESLQHRPKSSIKRLDSAEGDLGRSNDSSGRLCCLLDAFPVMAFFLLTKHILWPDHPDLDARARTDLQLLQDVHSCFLEVNSRTQTENRASQIDRVFELVLELIELLQNSSLDLASDDNPSGQISHVLTPNTPTLVVGSSGIPLNSTPGSTEVSWDFLNGQFGDTSISMTDQVDAGEGNRKRRRTADFDFSLNGSALGTLLPNEWSSMLDLNE